MADVDNALVEICIVFDHRGERWRHNFSVQRGCTVMDLKRRMIKQDSPKDDLISFDLLKRRSRLSNYSTIDENETFEFAYIGPAEGLRRAEQDTKEHETRLKRLAREPARRECQEKEKVPTAQVETEQIDKEHAKREASRKLLVDAAEAARKWAAEDLEKRSFKEATVAKRKVIKKVDITALAKGAAIWEVVKGLQKGLLVRKTIELSSAELPERISSGSLLRELKLDGDRLHFEKLTGRGPSSGWVTIRVKTKLDVIGLDGMVSVRQLVIPKVWDEEVENDDADQQQEHQKSNVSPGTVQCGVHGTLRGLCLQCGACTGWTRCQPLARENVKCKAADRLNVARGRLLPSLCEEVPDFGEIGQCIPERPAERKEVEQGSSLACACCNCPESAHEDVTDFFGRFGSLANEGLLPQEALCWSQVEVALWGDTGGLFRPDTARKSSPASMKKKMKLTRNSGSLVSVIAPTTGHRRVFHPFLWECFRSQRYEARELVIIDTCELEPSPFFMDKMESDPRVQYHHFHVPDGLWSVGLKRNLACWFAIGEVIAHFDDDDMYAGCFLKDMVACLRSPQGMDNVRLETSASEDEQHDTGNSHDQTLVKRILGDFGAACSKLSSWYTFSVATKKWGRYDTLQIERGPDMKPKPLDISQLYGWGFSMLFLKTAWTAVPFHHLQLGEDFDFVFSLRQIGVPVAFLHDAKGICAHTSHADNTASGADAGGHGFGGKLLFSPLSNLVGLYESAAPMLKKSQEPEGRPRTTSKQKKAIPRKDDKLQPFMNRVEEYPDEVGTFARSS